MLPHSEQASMGEPKNRPGEELVVAVNAEEHNGVEG